MYLVTHHALQDGKYGVTRAMAGVELSLRVGSRQPVGEFCKLVFALMIVEQMKSSDNRINRQRTCCKDVFQPAVSTSRKQQPTCVQSQFMAEIVRNVLPLRILDEKMLITFRHRVNVRYMRYDINAIANASAMLNRQQSLLRNLRPFGCNAVQIAALRIKLSADGIR